MTTMERGLVWALFAIMMAIGSWLLSTVTVNSARISVLEARTSNHSKEMDEMKADLRSHRQLTERR